MKKMIFKIAAVAAIGILLSVAVQAKSNDGYKDGGVQWLPMEATQYCYGTKTASGKKVRKGIAAAKKEWIGLVAAVYLDEEKEDGTHGPGQFLGYFEIEDTGSNEKIQNGTCIDLYNPDKEACMEFGRKNVWVVLRKGVG